MQDIHGSNTVLNSDGTKWRRIYLASAQHNDEKRSGVQFVALFYKITKRTEQNS
jgi:hypothetical protein